MELIKRATAPRKLREPRPIELLEVFGKLLDKEQSTAFSDSEKAKAAGNGKDGS